MHLPRNHQVKAGWKPGTKITFEGKVRLGDPLGQTLLFPRLQIRDRRGPEHALAQRCGVPIYGSSHSTLVTIYSVRPSARSAGG